MIIMNNYIEATCIGKPLGLPEWDEESELWLLFFEESETPWHPSQERDLISVSFESAQEVTDAYNHYNLNPVRKDQHEENVIEVA
jgi:hypothetical protein